MNLDLDAIFLYLPVIALELSLFLFTKPISY